MGQFYPSLSPSLISWALKQPLFFIASAPLHGSHVNVSPKGYPSASLAILSPTQAAYVDRTGSGCETLAHLYENGRATVMFCSFGPQPRILRLFCRGRVVEWEDPEFNGWLQRMGRERPPSARCVVVLDIWKVGTSCGYGVPRIRAALYAGGGGGGDERVEGNAAAGPGATIAAAPITPSPTVSGSPSDASDDDNGAAAAATAKERMVSPFEEFDPDKHATNNDLSEAALRALYLRRDETSAFEDRPTLTQRNAIRERNGTVVSYQQEVSARSLDGLPGLRAAMRRNGTSVVAARARGWARRVLWDELEAVLVGFALAVLLYAVVVGVQTAAPDGVGPLWEGKVRPLWDGQVWPVWEAQVAKWEGRLGLSRAG